jgi:hypothetical protein
VDPEEDRLIAQPGGMERERRTAIEIDSAVRAPRAILIKHI